MRRESAEQKSAEQRVRRESAEREIPAHPAAVSGGGSAGQAALSGSVKMEKQDPESRPSGLGLAMRLSTEMVAATLIGAGIGYGLDRWLHSGPWATLVFFLFGVAAGFRNLYYAANPHAEWKN